MLFQYNYFYHQISSDPVNWSSITLLLNNLTNYCIDIFSRLLTSLQHYEKDNNKIISIVTSDFHKNIIYPLCLELCCSDSHPIMITQLFPILLNLLKCLIKIKISQDIEEYEFISNYISIIARLLGKWSTALLICDPVIETIPYPNIYNGGLIDLYSDFEGYDGPIVYKDVIKWCEKGIITYTKNIDEEDNKDDVYLIIYYRIYV